MSLQELKQQIAGLSAEDQEEIRRFLNARRKRTPAEDLEIETLLNDQRPEAWLTLEESERRLGTEP